MKKSLNQSLNGVGTWSTVGIALAAAFWAGSAWASRAELDEAHASVAKAVQSLKAVEASEGAQTHISKAVGLLTRAQGEILKAKQVASTPPAK